MSAILVLIALMSVATLASRRGFAAFIAHIVTTPLLLGLGLLLSGRGLAFITASTSEALMPALRVGVAWLALLVGLRGARSGRLVEAGFDTVFVAITVALSWVGLTGVAFVAASLLGRLGLGSGSTEDATVLLGGALLVGGVLTATGLAFADEALGEKAKGKGGRRLLFLARHDDVVGALGLCAALWLWPLTPSVAPIYLNPFASVGATLGLGATLAAAHLLATGGRVALSRGATAIAVVGLVVFAAGLAESTHLPEAAMAFFCGVFLALAGDGKKLLEEHQLDRTERPVRLVVLVLVGTHLGFSPAAVLVGVALAAARLLIKVALRWVLNRQCHDELPLGAVLGSSGLAIPFALSFALTRPFPLVTNEVLTAVAVAVSLNDLFTLLVWRRPRLLDEERAGAGGEPAAEGSAA